MSEHHDLIRELDSFDLGGDTMVPTPPSEVRRLGDRRRAHRRTTIVVAASVIAVLAVGIPVALTRDGDPDGSRNISHTPSSTPAPSVTAEPAHPVITYPGEGVEVVADADTEQLTGTTAAFRTFIAGVARKMVAAGASCPDAFHGVTVRKYSSEGYALGGVNDCGGYAALWVQRDGVWQEGMGTQESWDCTTLSYLDVPRSFAGECADLAGGFGPEEVNGVRLGMTEAQVKAAGGLVPTGPAGACRTLLLPYESPVSNRTDGWFSPTDGVVAIGARPGMRTPERVGLGSPRAVVEAAYPGGSLQNGYWVVPLGDGAEYEIGLEEDGTVGELMLTRTTQDCFG